MVWSDRITWVSVDGWTNSPNLNQHLLPNSVIGLLPYSGSTPLRDRYNEKYLSYMSTTSEPVTEMSTPFVNQIVDAVFSLALSFQSTINSNSELSGAPLRESYYDALTNEVKFEGITGYVDFDAYGNPKIPSFSVKSFVKEQDVDSSFWRDVGYIASHYVVLNYNGIEWPDGSVGKTSNYSQQLTPYCLEGYEPVENNNMHECAMCRVNRKWAQCDLSS